MPSPLLTTLDLEQDLPDPREHLSPHLCHLPPWRWPRDELLAGRWMSARCSVCDFTGRVEGIGRRLFDCHCCLGLVKENAANSGGVTGWERYAGADLCTFEWGRLPAGQVETIQAYAQNLEEHLFSGWRLLLTGPVGSGKTHVGLALGVLALGLGFTAYATTLGEMLLAIRAGYQAEARRSELEMLESACAADLLILDDLGVEKPSDWARERLAHVINRWYADNLATVVTTNLGLDELEERWDQRVMSRLYGACQAVAVAPDTADGKPRAT